MIKVYISEGNVKEKKYTIDYIFSQFNYPYEIKIDKSLDNKYSLQYEDKKIIINDHFLNLNKYSIKKRSDHDFLFRELKFSNYTYYSFFGDSDVKKHTGNLEFEADIIGSIFWMISRYEEFFCDSNDSHGRFISVFSKLKQKNFHQPIVDINIFFLSKIFKLFFGLNIKLNNKYKLVATHDIDYPFVTKNSTFYSLIKSSIADLINRKSLFLAVKRLSSYFLNNLNSDPANNIEWIINANSNIFDKTIFFYISKSRLGPLDTLCDISDSDELNQLKLICCNKIEIGLHPSYLSSDNYSFLKEEKDILDNILNSISANEVLSSRQHYLRFNIRTHLNEFNNMKIKNEYSFGFSDYHGFRCGTCRPYKPYDVFNRRTLDFTVRPLIIMDTTLLKYLKYSENEIINLHKNYSATVKKYNGEFIILWHNTALMTEKRKSLYKNILKSIK